MHLLRTISAYLSGIIVLVCLAGCAPGETDDADESIGELEAVPFGADGAELVMRLIVGGLLFSGVAQESVVTLLAPSGADAARALSLPLLSSDERTRWWASPEAFVVDFDETVYAGGLTPTTLAALRALPHR